MKSIFVIIVISHLMINLEKNNHNSWHFGIDLEPIIRQTRITVLNIQISIPPK